MGCLAALSLAGCGGSGGGSSTVPSESLISEGYHLVLLSDDSNKVSYACILESDGKCLFYPHAVEQGNNPDFSVTGSWKEEFSGDGEFRITFSGSSKARASLDCGITFTQETITLTIPNMRAYRAGQQVAASFDQAPFTHKPGTNCPDRVTDAGTGLLLQMKQGRWTGISQ